MRVELQQRDLDLIRFVYAHRAVSFPQIRRKFFANRVKSTISGRLKALRNAGFIKSAMMPIKADYAERYFMPSEKALEFVRHHWGFEIDNPLYKSESIVHDLCLVDLAMRLEKLTCFKKLLTENRLQSSSALTQDDFLGNLVRAQSDGALFVTGKSGSGHLFSLELELSTKNVERYRSKLSNYYLAKGIRGVLYVCADQVIMSLLTKADEEVRKGEKSILHFALLDDALADRDKIIFTNAKSGGIELQ